VGAGIDALRTTAGDLAELAEEFWRFADEEVAPRAARHDAEEALDLELVRLLGEHGYLAPFLPQSIGGRGLDHVAYAALHEEIGRACSSTRSLLTVHDMVAHTILRWGGDELRTEWLPKLASGSALGAFALSEPHGGSDVQALRTRATRRERTFVLTGEKTWISFGQLADVFLVFARTEHGVSAFLVEREADGLEIEPIGGLLGLRASMLATLRFDGCSVPAEQLVGREGRAVPQVTTSALTLGRLGVACGSVGIVRACLDSAVAFARERSYGDEALVDRPLIQRMLAEMVTDVEAGHLLCLEAAAALDREDPRAPISAAIAKHFAARAAARSGRDAVQIHGAAGCTSAYPVERLYRDAKIMEIVEGSNEVQETLIGRHGYSASPWWSR
jgi:alkylation response protein AidB-like acyl-CoA dehydrogenase